MLKRGLRPPEDSPLLSPLLLDPLAADFMDESCLREKRSEVARGIGCYCVEGDDPQVECRRKLCAEINGHEKLT